METQLSRQSGGDSPRQRHGWCTPVSPSWVGSSPMVSTIYGARCLGSTLNSSSHQRMHFAMIELQIWMHTTYNQLREDRFKPYMFHHKSICLMLYSREVKVVYNHRLWIIKRLEIIVVIQWSTTLFNDPLFICGISSVGRAIGLHPIGFGGSSPSFRTKKYF